MARDPDFIEAAVSAAVRGAPLFGELEPYGWQKSVVGRRLGELQTSIWLRSRRCHGDQHCCGGVVANLRRKAN